MPRSDRLEISRRLLYDDHVPVSVGVRIKENKTSQPESDTLSKLLRILDEGRWLLTSTLMTITERFRVKVGLTIDCDHDVDENIGQLGEEQ